MHASKKLASLIILSLAVACHDHIAGTDATGGNPSSSTGSHGTDGASVTSDVATDSTAEESTTSLMGSTSAPGTGTSTGDDAHHSPVVCDSLAPAKCVPGDAGWCDDVVTLCDLLDPQNTNPGFCEDMGEICEAKQLSACAICRVLQRQCEIEPDTAIACDDYAATCGCLLDAHGMS